MSAFKQWTARFEAFTKAQDEPDWMTALRQRAWEVFLEKGLPDRHNERWKYTTLRIFGRQDFVTPSANTTDVAFESDDVEAIATISHINGHTDLGGSDLGRLKPDVAIRPLREAWEDARVALERRCDNLRDGFQALQFAFAADGAIVLIGNDVQLKEPIRITRRTTTKNAFAPTLDVIVVGRNAEATIFERHEGSADGACTGGLADVELKDGAHLEHVIIQEEPNTVWHMRIAEVMTHRDASYRAFTLGAGGRIGRNEHSVEICGPGVENELDGLMLARGSQLVDHTTLMDHAKPDGVSRQLNRAIVDDDAHTVFFGEVVIARDAQRSDSDQLNNNLLLSEGARADTRPQLVIGADDVKANHGATLGRIDEHEVFYLTSRAISQKEARRLLLRGFAQEVVLTIKNPSLQSLVSQRVRAWVDNVDNI